MSTGRVTNTDNIALNTFTVFSTVVSYTPLCFFRPSLTNTTIEKYTQQNQLLVADRSAREAAQI